MLVSEIEKPVHPRIAITMACIIARFSVSSLVSSRAFSVVPSVLLWRFLAMHMVPVH